MIEELFSIGSLSISPFGVMLVLALLTSYWQLKRGLIAGKIGDEEDASAIVFACGVAGILGGKLYYAILVGDPMMMLDRAGIVWYGSLIGGAAAFIWSVRNRGLPLAATFDAASTALPLGYAVGRVGCFLVGDDYGVPTDLPWGVAFENGLPPTTAGILRREFGVDVPAEIADSTVLAVHPTQLYTVFASLLIFAFALRLRRRVRWRPGNFFAVVLMIMSVERIMVEFLRAKDDRFFGVFTLAQLISVLIILLLGFILWRRGLRAPSKAGASP
ncbi:MAG: prolipoprotein diacylglyceryl transferase [Acidobacteriota bacterium]